MLKAVTGVRSLCVAAGIACMVTLAAGQELKFLQFPTFAS